MLKEAFQRLRHLIQSSMASAKRAADEAGQLINKKLKGEQTAPRADRKRKVALLIAYNGKGYYGLQVNPGFPSIESEVLKALLAAGVIPQDHHDCPQKMSFQRAARTDKGVSAAGNLLSLKMLLNVDNLLDTINKNLPPQIRVFECVRTTNGFNSKNHCSGRTYIYLLPTYAFAPVEVNCTLDYRTNPDIIEQANAVLEKFVGTHNFHNFTSGIKPTEACARRYIKQFECRQPFVRDGVEFCVLSVTGQSFMLHQIRKMVGLTIAIMRGFANSEAIDEAWEHEKMDIPKAPGLGLMLDKLHYDQYNTKWASDGSHEKIDFAHLKEALDKFKEEYIFSEIIKEEVETQSMMQWLSKLHFHSCSTVVDKWSERKRIDKVLSSASQDTSDTEQEKGQSGEQTSLDIPDTETVNRDDKSEEVSEPSSDTSQETFSANRVKAVTSSAVCDSVCIEGVTSSAENNGDQSNELREIKSGSSG